MLEIRNPPGPKVVERLSRSPVLRRHVSRYDTPLFPVFRLFYGNDAMLVANGDGVRHRPVLPMLLLRAMIGIRGFAGRYSQGRQGQNEGCKPEFHNSSMAMRSIKFNGFCGLGV